MSSPLAIGAVSAVLRNLLDNGFVDVGPPLSPVDVTAIAPDRINLEDPDASPSLNLFLYRTSVNQGWAQAGLPAYSGNGARLSNPPLALNLHYLVTAYGVADFQAEILLGYAMHLLHERPVLDRPAIRRALDPSPLGTTILPPAFQALTASDLADQVDGIKITHEPLDGEEMSRLWSAIQSHYRPSASYVVSVVLIEARHATRTGLPVLERSFVAEPSLLPPYPTIERVVPPPGQTAARLGEEVRLTGHHLDGTAAVVRFAHHLLAEPHEISVGTVTDAAEIKVTVPSGGTTAEEWPAGVYVVSVSIVRPGEARPRESNVAAMLLAPVPELPPTVITRDPASRRVTLQLDVSPEVWPEQAATLNVGGATALAAPRSARVATLDFELGDVPPNDQWLRLTVDGVDSLLVDRSAKPPKFHPSQSVAVPT